MTVLFTDPFAGGNATPPNANWTNTLNAGLRTISNQLAAQSGGNDGAARVTAGTFPDDQYAQMVMKTVGDRDGGPAVRMDASGNCYFCTNFNATDIFLYAIVGGSFNFIDQVTGVFQVNDAIRIEVEGTTVRIKVNGSTVLTSTGRTELSTGRPGAFIFGTADRWDDFEAGDFNTGATVSPSGLASAAVFGTAVVELDTLQVLPSGLASAAVFGTATISVATESVLPAGIASAAVYGTATITKPSQSVFPSGLASAAVFGTTVVSNVVVSQGVPSAAVYGTANVQVTLEQISPAGLASAAVYGSHTISVQLESILPSGVSSPSAVGSPTIGNVAAQVVNPSGVASAAVYGTPTVTSVVPTNQTLSPSGIASAAVYGSHTVGLVLEVIGPSGVVSPRTVGIAQVLGGADPLPEINLPIPRATSQTTTIRTLSFAVAGKELPYPVYRGRFSSRRANRFLEQPGHNPFAGLDEDE